MLVLTRKSGESIEIGDNILVRVLAIKNGIVKLGFDAPRDVPINRTERERTNDSGSESND